MVAEAVGSFNDGSLVYTGILIKIDIDVQEQNMHLKMQLHSREVNAHQWLQNK